MGIQEHGSKISSIVKIMFLTVWTIVGIVLLVLVGVAHFGDKDTWVENLNITSVTEEAAPPQQQPQQPPQPTQENLDCIGEELGQERLAELQEGGQAESEEEAATIQKCLQT